MLFKTIIDRLNVFAQCQRYGLSIWQCPQFIFLIMGIITIVSSISTYYIGNRYVQSPETVALIIIALTTFLLVIAFIITQGFERLAEANRMKSEFISIVSHQLRSPLTNLKWAIELLMSGEVGRIDESQLEYFKILKENSSRMGELVSDLLTVLGIEQRKLSINKKEISLEELTKELIFGFKSWISASNIKVGLEVEKNLPKILADPSQIKLVIENLLDNAIRYTKERGIVEIKIFKKEKDICFIAKDSGIGIPLQDQKHIFQKFFRSGNAMRYQTKGSGLGLFITKAIIEKSGGKINFKSGENEGSTFWFTLPIK